MIASGHRQISQVRMGFRIIVRQWKIWGHWAYNAYYTGFRIHSKGIVPFLCDVQLKVCAVCLVDPHLYNFIPTIK